MPMRTKLCHLADIKSRDIRLADFFAKRARFKGALAGVIIMRGSEPVVSLARCEPVVSQLKFLSGGKPPATPPYLTSQAKKPHYVEMKPE